MAVLDRARRGQVVGNVKHRYQRGGTVRGPGVRVVLGEMDPSYDPPSASMDPEAVVPAWRHPLFRDRDLIEVTTLGQRGAQYVEGPCRHSAAVPVESVLGELVAWLCPVCDAQLDAEWRSL
jgi:hypothetical protein